MNGRICLWLMYGLECVDDDVCVECWESNRLSAYYCDRQECQEENCVTLEEFDELENQRHRKPIPSPAYAGAGIKGN